MNRRETGVKREKRRSGKLRLGMGKGMSVKAEEESKRKEVVSVKRETLRKLTDQTRSRNRNECDNKEERNWYKEMKVRTNKV